MTELTTKRLLSALLVVALLVMCRTLLAKSQLSDFKSEKGKLTLKPGEKLVYSVYWMKVPVGRAVLHVKDMTEVDGKSAYHITAYTRANRIIRLFYKVDDRITSYVEVDGFRPLKFEKQLREGKRKKDERIDFDWEKKEAIYLEFKGSKQKKRKIMPLVEGAQDVLSCLYFMRGLRMEVGKECAIKVITEEKCWNLVIKPIKKTKVKLRKLGKFDALLIEPIVDFEGLFVHDRKLQIWLDEETKIPLIILADIPIGSIRLVLRSVENTVEKKKDEEPSTEKPKESPWTRKTTTPAGRRDKQR